MNTSLFLTRSYLSSNIAITIFFSFAGNWHVVLRVGEVKSTSLQQRPYDGFLELSRKQSVVSDLLINIPIKGESSPLMSLTSHVSAGSSWHVLFGAELIRFATSSTVTAVKSASDDVT